MYQRAREISCLEPQLVLPLCCCDCCSPHHLVLFSLSFLAEAVAVVEMQQPVQTFLGPNNSIKCCLGLKDGHVLKLKPDEVV